jgi:ABC-type Mn2+/Zn2+ transport system ATPase subunit
MRWAETMDDSSGSAIESERATIAYRNVPVLREFSMRVGDGELVGIFGPNGTGKSTFLKSLLGLSRITAGKIAVFGHQVIPKNMPVIRRLAAYVPQCFEVDRRMPFNSEEVVLMGRSGQMGLLRQPDSSDRTAVLDAFRMLSIEHLARRPFGLLSGGERQRVVIARALAQKPKLLLMDEPTNSLDWESQRRICGLIREIHVRRHLTTVIVSHDIDLLAETCDRILLMDLGQIVGEQDPTQFRRYHQTRPPSAPVPNP